jgi:replicative DNA helicase
MRERRNSPRPQLADLRDAGTIEEEADAVVFLWTAEERPEGKENLPIKPFLAKNRHGRTGEPDVRWVSSMSEHLDHGHAARMGLFGL